MGLASHEGLGHLRTSITRPVWPASAARAADKHGLAEALGSPGHDLALKGASGEPGWLKPEPPCFHGKQTVTSATELKAPSSVVSGTAPALVAASAASIRSSSLACSSATEKAGSGHACFAGSGVVVSAGSAPAGSSARRTTAERWSDGVASDCRLGPPLL